MILTRAEIDELAAARKRHVRVHQSCDSLIGGKRVNIYMDKETDLILERAGGGNRSAGIRMVAEFWAGRNAR